MKYLIVMLCLLCLPAYAIEYRYGTNGQSKGTAVKSGNRTRYYGNDGQYEGYSVNHNYKDKKTSQESDNQKQYNTWTLNGNKQE